MIKYVCSNNKIMDKSAAALVGLYDTETNHWLAILLCLKVRRYVDGDTTGEGDK